MKHLPVHKNHFIFLVFFFLIMYSCKKPTIPAPAEDRLIYNEKNRCNISSLITGIEYIPLEDGDETFIKEPSKIIIEKDRIYIGDTRYTYKIAVFTITGQYLYTLDKKGEGPEEYVQMRGFAVDDSLIYHIDNYSLKIRLYDKYTGNYKGEKKLPFMIDDLHVFHNGDFIISVHPYGEDYKTEQLRHRLFITDRSLNIKEAYLPYEANEADPIGKRFYFTSDNENIYFNIPMRDEYYSISKSVPDKLQTISVDFGEKSIPAKLRNDYESSDPFRYMYETPYHMDGYVLFDIRSGDYFENFIYHITDKKWYKNDESTMHNYLLPVSYACDKTLYSLFYNGIDSYKYWVEEGFPRASDAIEKHLEDDGWVLIKYTLK